VLHDTSAQNDISVHGESFGRALFILGEIGVSLTMIALDVQRGSIYCMGSIKGIPHYIRVSPGYAFGVLLLLSLLLASSSSSSSFNKAVERDFHCYSIYRCWQISYFKRLCV